MLRRCSSNQPGMNSDCVTIGLNHVSSVSSVGPRSAGPGSARSGARARSAGLVEVERHGRGHVERQRRCPTRPSPRPLRWRITLEAIAPALSTTVLAGTVRRRPSPSRACTRRAAAAHEDPSTWHSGRTRTRPGKSFWARAASSPAPTASPRHSRCCSSRDPRQPTMLHSTTSKRPLLARAASAATTPRRRGSGAAAGSTGRCRNRARARRPRPAARRRGPLSSLGSSQRSSTWSGRSKQTALLTTVLPPTHMPCATWKRKSLDIVSAPSAYRFEAARPRSR